MPISVNRHPPLTIHLRLPYNIASVHPERGHVPGHIAHKVQRAKNAQIIDNNQRLNSRIAIQLLHVLPR